MAPTWSRELEQIRMESRNVAEESGRTLSSAHLLLGLFLVTNRAVLFFHELQITFELLLRHLEDAREPSDLVERIERRAVDVARTSGHQTINSLHLLISITSFPASAACGVMRAVEIDVERIRDAAFETLRSQQPPRDERIRDRAQRARGAGAQTGLDGSLSPDTTSPRSTPLPNDPAATHAADTSPPSTSSASGPALRVESPLAQRVRAGLVRATQPSRPASVPPTSRDAGEPREERTNPALARKFLLPEQKYPTLTRLGRNLTWLAHQGRIDPVWGRDNELRQVVDILNKRRANNPVLVGEPGVGKTAIVEGLARALAGLDAHEAGPALQGRILIEIEASRLFAGATARGAVAERLQAIRSEVAQSRGAVILFLDELHHWLGASSDDLGDGTGELKTALARGELPCVGATTDAEYRRYIETDSAFARRFDVVRVQEPSVEDAVRIVRTALPAWAEHHGIAFDDDAVTAAVELTHRFVPDRRLPDKAFQALDLAGSRARRVQLDRVTPEILVEVVAEHAGIPASRLSMSDAERFLRLDQTLLERIIGQEHAVGRVAAALRRNYAGFMGRRPVGSFLFLGPTGVGKTEFAKALCNAVFGADDAMTRIDMSEFHESHAMMRLIGAPPGYVGFEGGGQLTEAVRRRPWQLVLFDEVEKAHPDVLNLLLQILEDGRLTDGRGRTVDFRHTIILLTSNLGAEQFGAGSTRRVGFGPAPTVDAHHEDVRERVIETARAHLRPEVWNRLDEALVFTPLARNEVRRIAHLLLRDSSRRLAEQRAITYACSDTVVDWLIDHGGYDPSLGARPMRRTIETRVESVIAEAILRGTVSAGSAIHVDLDQGALTLHDLRAPRDIEEAN